MNSFTCNTCLPASSIFVGRHHEIYHVLQRLLNLESTSIVGERCLGKTWLLSHLMNSDSLSTLGLYPPGWLFIHVDLQQFQAGGTVVDFWSQVLAQMSSDVAELSLTHTGHVGVSFTSSNPVYLVRNAVDVLAAQQRQPVLVLDDFDLLADNSNFGIDFLNGLRSLAIGRNPLPVITTSRKPLIDLFDYSVVSGSPFFNIFATVHVGLLNSAEAQQLLNALIQNSSVHFSVAERQRIITLADSHPYLLHLAEELLSGIYRNCPGTEECLQQWEQQFRQAAHPLLVDYWEHSSPEEKGLLFVLATLALEGSSQLHTPAVERAFNPSRGVLHRLVERGLVTKNASVPQPASTVFAEWIMAEARRNKDYPTFIAAWREADQITANALGSALLASVERFLRQPA